MPAMKLASPQRVLVPQCSWCGNTRISSDTAQCDEFKVIKAPNHTVLLSVARTSIILNNSQLWGVAPAPILRSNE
eukprot:3388510-Pleurochrysis_carterae.AAC.3